MAKDVTLKQGEEFVYPRTFTRNVYIDGNVSLETLLAQIELRLAALEEVSGNKTQVIANPSTTPTEELESIQIDEITYKTSSGIEIIREG